jgi:hypothetical protein
MARRRRRERFRSPEDVELLALADQLEEDDDAESATVLRARVEAGPPADVVDLIRIRRRLRRRNVPTPPV